MLAPFAPGASAAELSVGLVDGTASAGLPAWVGGAALAVLMGLTMAVAFVLLLRREVARRTLDLRAANQKLLNRQQELFSIFRESADGIALVDEGVVCLANPAWFRLFQGRGAAPAIGQRMSELLPSEQRSGLDFLGADTEVKNPFPRRIALSAIPGNSDSRDLELHLSAINDIPGTNRLLVMAHDITNQRYFTRLLEQSEKQLRRTLEYAHLGIWMIDLAGREMVWTEEMYRIFGTDNSRVGPVYPFFWKSIHPDDLARVRQSMGEKTTAGKMTHLHFRIKRANGQTRTVWGETYGIDRDADGSIRRIRGYLQDVTEREQIAIQLQDSLNEKETLLRELYHRTKNNMYLVCSMLEMANPGDDEPMVNQAFRDMVNRIHSIALVHEKLYRSANLARIDFQAYVRDLALLLTGSFSGQGKAIQFNFELPNLVMPVDVAVPLGLVLNELFVNAYKYAFPDATEGKVELACSAGGDQLSFTVRDNGIGVPSGFGVTTHAKLGLTLVSTIIERQLQGTIDTRAGQSGFEFSFRIPFCRKA